ncbi:MAG TPA: glyceraldehyde 3-phosphate dehydrogenase NAD-binding domain-containing protein, partial [Dehalococcoidia bacterium]|nr:glyceraldehyde 3-phosphate dehydrogenase NAD-binding domain-containing protein [Dehalococcoidia bacterium]
MATRVGINGFGRIGRQVLRTIRERHGGELQIVAINDLVDVDTNVHLLKYDSNYGRFNGDVKAIDGGFSIDGEPIRVFAERDPSKIPWGDAGVEIVIESTGFFTDGTQAVAHKHDSVQKVIISAPARNEDVTIVLGVNDEKYDPAKHHVISNASCTTNGLAPPVKVLVEEFGFLKGQMTTIHSYTNSQQILDKAG